MSDVQQADSPPRFTWSMAFWLVLAIIAGVFLVYRLTVPPGPVDPVGVNHPAVGQPLRHLQLEPLVGTDEALTLEQIRGEVVLINYWGTWCPPCRLEFPELMQLRRTLQRYPDFRLLSVSCRPPIPADGETIEETIEELKDATARYLREENYRLPIYSDVDIESRIALMESAELQEFGFPTTVLLDRDGTIRGLWPGYALGVVEEMQEAAEALLKQEQSG